MKASGFDPKKLYFGTSNPSEKIANSHNFVWKPPGSAELWISKRTQMVSWAFVAVNMHWARILWWKLLGNPLIFGNLGILLGSSRDGAIVRHLHLHIPTKHLSSVSRKVLGNCPAQVTTPSSASRFPSKDRSLMLAEPTWSVDFGSKL